MTHLEYGVCALAGTVESRDGGLCEIDGNLCACDGGLGERDGGVGELDGSVSAGAEIVVGGPVSRVAEHRISPLPRCYSCRAPARDH